ncbi:MAG: hypothetical protein WHU94_15345, partial [Thermogemmata sp.]
MIRWATDWWRRWRGRSRSPTAWLWRNAAESETVNRLARAMLSLPGEVLSAPLPWGEEAHGGGVIDLRHGAIRNVSFLPPS